MARPFDEIADIKDSEQRAEKLARLLDARQNSQHKYPDIPHPRREDRFAKIVGVEPESSAEAFLAADPRYATFGTANFAQGEAGRAGYLLGLIHGLMLADNYRISDFLEAQYDDTCEASAKEKEYYQKVMNCFVPDDPEEPFDPLNPTEAQTAAFSEKYAKLVARSMKGYSKLDMKKEVRAVMERCNAPEGMSELEYSHTPEGMMWTSEFMGMMQNHMQEFNQQWSRAYDTKAGKRLVAGEPAEIANRPYFGLVMKEMSPEDHTNFNKIIWFMNTSMRQNMQRSYVHAYADMLNAKESAINEDAVMPQGDGIRTPGVYLFNSAMHMALVDTMLKQEGTLGDQRLPNCEYFTPMADAAGNAERTRKIKNLDKLSISDYAGHLNNISAFTDKSPDGPASLLTKERAANCLVSEMADRLFPLRFENKEDFEKKVSNYLLPGQDPAEVTRQVLRIHPPYTLKADEIDKYLDQQNAIISESESTAAQLGPVTGEKKPMRAIFDYRLETDKLKRDIVSSMKDQMEHPGKTVSVDQLENFRALPFERHPEDDGFGDLKKIDDIYLKETPADYRPNEDGFNYYEGLEKKRREFTADRLFDRLESFDPSVHTDGATMGKYLKSYQKLMDMMGAEPEFYQQKLEQRYSTPAAKERFEAKKNLMDALSACASHELTAAETAQKMNAALHKLDLLSGKTAPVKAEWPELPNQLAFVNGLSKHVHEGAEFTNPEDLKTLNDTFDKIFSGFSNGWEDKLRKDNHLQLFDMIFIDGRSVREIAETTTLYKDPQYRNREQLMRALVVDAIATGEKPVDMAEMYYDAGGKAKTGVTSVQVDLKNLGQKQYGEHNFFRRMFNFVSEIETAETKSQKLYSTRGDDESRFNRISKSIEKTQKNIANAAVGKENAGMPEPKEAVDMDLQAYKNDLLRLTADMQRTDSSASTLKPEYKALSEHLEQYRKELKNSAPDHQKLDRVFAVVEKDCMDYMRSHENLEKLSPRMQQRLKVITRILDLNDHFRAGDHTPLADPQKAIAQKLIQNVTIQCLNATNRSKDPEIARTTKDARKTITDRKAYLQRVSVLQKTEDFKRFAESYMQDPEKALKTNGVRLLDKFNLSISPVQKTNEKSAQKAKAADKQNAAPEKNTAAKNADAKKASEKKTEVKAK